MCNWAYDGMEKEHTPPKSFQMGKPAYYKPVAPFYNLHLSLNQKKKEEVLPIRQIAKITTPLPK